jgi:hypothetical protein
MIPKFATKLNIKSGLSKDFIYYIIPNSAIDTK